MGHPLAPGIGAAPLCAPPKIKRSMFVWGTLTLPAQGLRLSALPPLRRRDRCQYVRGNRLRCLDIRNGAKQA